MNLAGKFRRELLPLPQVFYADALGKLSRPSRGWSQGNCVFHQSRSQKSFAINLSSGGFYCHGCGAKGGDVVAFLMLRDGIDFVSAAKKLGAWDDAPAAKSKRSQKVIVGRDLVCDFRIDDAAYSVRVTDDPDWLNLLRRIYRGANDRLVELSKGDGERFDGETENCWSIMADTLPQLRAAEVSQ